MKETKIKPMLAVETDLDSIEYPVYCGIKYDGVRMLVLDGVCYSRSLKPIRNKYVQKLFGKKVYDGFDGEIVVGDIHAKDVFQKTTSGVMSEDGEPDVKFYVFDNFLLKDLPYSQRAEDIKNRLHWFKGDALDATAIYMHNRKQVEEVLNIEAALGGEGIILRKPEAKYKYGRSTKKEAALMKVKFFTIEEFEVVGFVEQMHNNNEATLNELGYTERSTSKENLIPMNTLGSLVVKFNDTTFNVGTGFTQEQRKEIWDNRDKYVGKLASVKYMTTGIKTLPRHPVWQGWRHEDDL